MQLIPVFKIGILNAWIFTVIFFVPTIIMLFNKEAYKKLGTPPDMKLSKSEKIVGQFVNIVCYAAFVYSIFLPFKLGTAWFYIGLFIFLLAIVVLITVFISFITTPINKPVTKGIYNYSRHPGYLSHFLTFIGIGIATASWIILLVAIIFFILGNIIANTEERYCKEKYGDTYREYFNKVPRWIGIPKS